MNRLLRAARIVAIAVCLPALAGCVQTATPVPSVTATPVLDTGVTYGTADGTPLLLDVCRPASGSDLPMLVLVHGGAFTTGSRTTLQPQCIDAAEHGFVTFVVDYRLVQQGVAATEYPAQLRDVAAAVEWITAAAQTRTYATDPHRLVLLGESAGAVIAAQLAVGVPGSTIRPSLFAGVILLSGVYDFGAKLPADLAEIEYRYFGCSASVPCSDAAAASPIAHVRRGDPPTLLIGSSDELVPADQATAFAAALAAKGVEHTLTIVPGTAHAIGIAEQNPSVAREIWAFASARSAS